MIKFCENGANMQKLKVTKFQIHGVSGYGENYKSISWGLGRGVRLPPPPKVDIVLNTLESNGINIKSAQNFLHIMFKHR